MNSRIGKFKYFSGMPPLIDNGRESYLARRPFDSESGFVGSPNPSIKDSVVKGCVNGFAKGCAEDFAKGCVNGFAEDHRFQRIDIDNKVMKIIIAILRGCIIQLYIMIEEMVFKIS